MTYTLATESVQCPVCTNQIKVRLEAGPIEATDNPDVKTITVTRRWAHDCPGSTATLSVFAGCVAERTEEGWR